MAKTPDKVSKAKAGRILNSLLRKIAEEPTEYLTGITEPGDDRFVSKAEALARTVYRLALGYTEKRMVLDSNGTETERLFHIPPDRHMIMLVWDRLEGKVGSADELNDKRGKIADRVSEQGKKRIQAAGGVLNESGE